MKKSILFLFVLMTSASSLSGWYYPGVNLAFDSIGGWSAMVNKDEQKKEIRHSLQAGFVDGDFLLSKKHANAFNLVYRQDIKPKNIKSKGRLFTSTQLIFSSFKSDILNERRFSAVADFLFGYRYPLGVGSYYAWNIGFSLPSEKDEAFGFGGGLELRKKITGTKDHNLAFTTALSLRSFLTGRKRTINLFANYSQNNFTTFEFGALPLIEKKWKVDWGNHFDGLVGLQYVVNGFVFDVGYDFRLATSSQARRSVLSLTESDQEMIEVILKSKLPGLTDEQKSSFYSDMRNRLNSLQENLYPQLTAHSLYCGAAYCYKKFFIGAGAIKNLSHKGSESIFVKTGFSF